MSVPIMMAGIWAEVAYSWISAFSSPISHISKWVVCTCVCISDIIVCVKICSKQKFKSVSVSENLKLREVVRTRARKKKDNSETFRISMSTLLIILTNDGYALHKIIASNVDCKRKRATGFPNLKVLK